MPLYIATRQSFLGYVYAGLVPVGSGPNIGPDKPSVYMGPFWNWSGPDPNRSGQVQNGSGLALCNPSLV